MTSFGASLRRERELRGVSLQQIAASTKIGVSMLQAIEDDRFDKLPQGLFVRGFVREYARFLALDEQKILTELSFHASQNPVAQEAVSEPGRRVSSRFAARLVNGGLIAGIFGVVGILILSPSFSSRGPAPSAVPAVNAPSPAVVQAPGTQVASNGASVLPAVATSASTSRWATRAVFSSPSTPVPRGRSEIAAR
jgi:cytoskeleton protein RodZ